ncbi:hypothetical protein L7F22_010358 [Adiantum nelumboides]|nr:hypothetical protein [Adiantum nelumboides]
MRSAAAAIRSARLVLAQSRRSTHQGRVIGAPVVGAGKVADQDTSLKESISKEHALSKKLTLTDSSLHKSVPYSDGLLLSVGEERKLGFNLHLKYVSVSLRSLQWNASQIQNTFARGYASSNKKTSSPSRKQEWKTSSKSRKQEQKTSSQSKKQELKMSDEDEDEDDNEAEGSLEDDADYDKISDDDDHDVLDEQRISDIDDASDNEEEKEEKGSEGMQYQVPKKKFEIHSPKPKVVNEGPILNEKITARTLRLVDEDNRGHRIVLRDEALFLAKKKQMDLVLVDAKRDPPVCKIFSYMREKYKKEQAVKEKKKTKLVKWSENGWGLAHSTVLVKDGIKQETLFVELMKL